MFDQMILFAIARKRKHNSKNSLKLNLKKLGNNRKSIKLDYQDGLDDITKIPYQDINLIK